MNILCCCLAMAPNTKITRKWEVFAGRNKFYCDGYCMTAPNSGVFYLTVILITVTSGLFFVFDCPYLADNISPIIPIIGGFLFIFTMSSLLRTSFSDPGIIPRASSDEAAYIEKQIEVPNSLNSPTYRPPPRTKEVFVKGQTVKLKYCFTCKIFRPPRASHCSLCDNCVDRFDHHCPWVGNCVGKRNYRFFYMFIVSLAFLAVFIFACSTTHLVMSKEKKEFIDVIKQSPSSVVVAVICFFSVWSVIGLAGFHTYLTTSDQTTNEDIKGSFTSKGGQQSANPYSQGNICLNCFHILCGPITPSLIDRRGLVNDEFRLQMQQQYQAKPTLVVQPMRNIDSSMKQLNVDLESGSGGAQFPPGGGVYRQRSYDNLQNEKSNSSAHLVDNEIPLANVDSPIESQPQQHTQMGTSITTANFQLFDEINNSSNNIHSITNIADDDDHEQNDANNMMMRNTNDNTNDSNMLGKSNNLGDSYNNLFRDSKQSNEINEIEVIDEQALPATAIKTKMASTPLRKNFRSIENVYSNVVPATTSTTQAEISLEVVANMSTAASPSSTTTLLDKSSSISNEFNKSDPNLHVYSNISSPKSAIKKLRPTTSSTNVSLTQMDDENSILNSSFLLTNDLDLDDPVLSSTLTTTPTAKKIFNSTFNTSATVSNSGGRYLKQNAIKTTNINTMLDASASATTSTTTITTPAAASKIATIEMKNILPKIGMVEVKTSTPASNKSKTVHPSGSTSNYNGNSGGSTATMGKNTNTSVSSNAPFISPNRRRLLHDTTMIDTALDLDSLDGSSIGNSSQATLSKTAVV